MDSSNSLEQQLQQLAQNIIKLHQYIHQCSTLQINGLPPRRLVLQLGAAELEAAQIQKQIKVSSNCCSTDTSMSNE